MVDINIIKKYFYIDNSVIIENYPINSNTNLKKNLKITDINLEIYFKKDNIELEINLRNDCKISKNNKIYYYFEWDIVNSKPNINNLIIKTDKIYTLYIKNNNKLNDIIFLLEELLNYFTSNNIEKDIKEIYDGIVNDYISNVLQIFTFIKNNSVENLVN